MKIMGSTRAKMLDPSRVSIHPSTLTVDPDVQSLCILSCRGVFSYSVLDYSGIQ